MPSCGRTGTLRPFGHRVGGDAALPARPVGQHALRMAWEWVAPVAAAGGASIGAITTMLTARGGRAHAEQLAVLNAEHAERTLLDERRQRRFAEAYVDVLQLVEQMGQWAQMVRPVIDTDPPRELPVTLPSLGEQARVQALAKAYGTPIVNQLLSEHQEIMKRILHSDRVLGLADAAQKKGKDVGIEPLKVWQQLINIEKPAEVAKREELAAQVATELR